MSGKVGVDPSPGGGEQGRTRSPRGWPRPRLGPRLTYNQAELISQGWAAVPLHRDSWVAFRAFEFERHRRTMSRGIEALALVETRRLGQCVCLSAAAKPSPKQLFGGRMQEHPPPRGAWGRWQPEAQRRADGGGVRTIAQHANRAKLSRSTPRPNPQISSSHGTVAIESCTLIARSPCRT